MTAPLSGIKVLEVANWLAAPAATALMADLGADVVKVEAPGGDVLRHFDMAVYGYENYDFPGNTVFELDNRGKRSVVVALDRPEGPDVVHRLLADADILVLNLTPRRRQRYRLTEADVRATNARIIYASLTGYGSTGPDADRAGFDFSAFWARSGIMGAIGEPGTPPTLCRGGQGDHTTSLNLLAAVLAALRQRDLGGEAPTVEVSLQGTGMWTVAGDLSAALVTRELPPRPDRNEPSNPIWNTYETRDGRWMLFVMPVSDAYWPRFCRAISKPEWSSDARYDDPLKRKAESRFLTAAIGECFASRTLAEWRPILDEEGLIWAPAVDFLEVIDDPQPRAMGAFVTLEHPEAGPFETLAPPFRISNADVGPKTAAPAVGQHTREALSSAGFSPEQIDDLLTRGVVE